MEQLWLELWEQERNCRARRLRHLGDRTEKRRVQEQGWDGRGEAGRTRKEHKGICGTEGSPGKGSGGRWMPRAAAGQGEGVPELDPCGMGAAGEAQQRGGGDTRDPRKFQGERDKTETSRAGVGRRKSSGKASFLGEGLGEEGLQTPLWGGGRRSPQCLIPGGEGDGETPKAPLGVGRRERRDPRGLAGFFFGAVRVSEHPQTSLLEGKDFLRPRSGEERVKAIPEGPGKGGVKKKSLGLWGIKTSQRFGVFFFFLELAVGEEFHKGSLSGRELRGWRERKENDSWRPLGFFYKRGSLARPRSGSGEEKKTSRRGNKTPWRGNKVPWRAHGEGKSRKRGSLGTGGRSGG